MNKLKTSLREVLLYIKYSKDKEQLQKVISSDERFKRVERNAAMVINAITHSEIKFDEKEEVVNMCQAIMEMREEERLFEREETAKRMLKLGKYTLEEIAMCSNLSVERIKELQNEI